MQTDKGNFPWDKSEKNYEEILAHIDANKPPVAPAKPGIEKPGA